MLRPPSALIHYSSGSVLKSILADVYILKLVVRAVFHVETMRPALQPLLSITLTIRLCWVQKGKTWHFCVFMMLLSHNFLSSHQTGCHQIPNPHISDNQMTTTTLFTKKKLSFVMLLYRLIMLLGSFLDNFIFCLSSKKSIKVLIRGSPEFQKSLQRLQTS